MPKKKAAPSIDATVTIEVEYNGTYSEAFTIKNVDGFILKSRKNPKCLYDDIMAGIKAKLGNVIV